MGREGSFHNGASETVGALAPASAQAEPGRLTKSRIENAATRRAGVMGVSFKFRMVKGNETTKRLGKPSVVPSMFSGPPQRGKCPQTFLYAEMDDDSVERGARLWC